MMFGNRAPMKRTSSMTEFTLDNLLELDHPHDPFNGPGSDQRFPGSAAGPPNYRRNSADFGASANHFLLTCSLCKRRLVPGHDTYMYRGDNAFCSLECREYQITQDDKQDKRTSASKNATASTTTTTTTTTGGTVANV